MHNPIKSKPLYKGNLSKVAIFCLPWLAVIDRSDCMWCTVTMWKGPFSPQTFPHNSSLYKCTVCRHDITPATTKWYKIALYVHEILPEHTGLSNLKYLQFTTLLFLCFQLRSIKWAYTDIHYTNISPSYFNLMPISKGPKSKLQAYLQRQIHRTRTKREKKLKRNKKRQAFDY